MGTYERYWVSWSLNGVILGKASGIFSQQNNTQNKAQCHIKAIKS